MVRSLEPARISARLTTVKRVSDSVSLSSSQASVRVCDRTGVALVSYPAMGTWRVFKEVYGPLKGRPRTSDDPDEWSRFDLPGQATLYSATERKGAYAESLADFRPRIEVLAKMAQDIFDDVGSGQNPIVDEWCSRGHMFPGNIPAVWHVERRIAQIHVPVPGWYVDVEHPESLNALRPRMAGLLHKQKMTDFDVAAIRSENRVVTCAVAELLLNELLDDGSYPLGIRYNSRLGTEWECWANFPETTVEAVDTQPLDLSADSDLAAITELFGLRLH